MFLIWLTPFITRAQLIAFEEPHQNVKVFQGDTLLIQTDTAFVISKSYARRLNERLDELFKNESYKELAQMNHQLMNQLGEIKRRLGALLNEMETEIPVEEKDHNTLLNELEFISRDFRQVNREFADNNNQLQRQLTALHKDVKHLKRTLKKTKIRGPVIGAMGGLLLGILAF